MLHSFKSLSVSTFRGLKHQQIGLAGAAGGTEAQVEIGYLGGSDRVSIILSLVALKRPGMLRTQHNEVGKLLEKQEADRKGKLGILGQQLQEGEASIKGTEMGEGVWVPRVLGT